VRSYLDDFFLREASSTGFVGSFASMRLPGEFLVSVGLEGSRLSLKDTVCVSFMSRMKTAVCL
jgi:hypothetical protein